jgi:hypothetical protein
MAAGVRVRVTEKGPGTAKLEAALRSAAAVTVGVHDSEGQAPKQTLEDTGKTKPDGSPKTAKVQAGTGERLIDVVLAHELGIGTPRRSIIGDWFDEKLDTELRTKLKRGMLEAAKRGHTTEQALQRFGAWAAGSIKRRIRAGIAPPLSPRRLAEKARVNAKSTPLIFTGQQISSIMSKLEKK